MTEPVAAPAPPKAAPTVTDLDGTEYVIPTKSGAMWEQGKTRTARSAEAAIRESWAEGAMGVALSSAASAGTRSQSAVALVHALNAIRLEIRAQGMRLEHIIEAR